MTGSPSPLRARSVAGATALLLTVSSCQTTGPSAYPERVALPTSEEPYVLPTSICGDYFLVDLWLNGDGPWSVILDTGAARTILDPDVVRAADLDGSIDSLRIGEYDAFDVGYGTLDMEELSVALGAPVYGILGHPVFAGTLVTYDYLEREVVLTPGALTADDPSVVAARQNARPFVRSTVGGTTRWVLLDTGSSRGLTLRNPGELPLSSPLTTTGARVRVDGVHLVQSGRVEGEAQIGLMRVAEPVVSNSVSVDLVGQEVLRHYRITFDQRNDLVRFERPEALLEEPVPSLGVRSRGFALQPLPSYGEVIHVWYPSSPVETGDRVISFGDRPWSERTCPTTRIGDLADPVADTLELTLVRGSDTLSVMAPRAVVHPRLSR